MYSNQSSCPCGFLFDSNNNNIKCHFWKFNVRWLVVGSTIECVEYISPFKLAEFWRDWYCNAIGKCKVVVYRLNLHDFFRVLLVMFECFACYSGFFSVQHIPFIHFTFLLLLLLLLCVCMWVFVFLFDSQHFIGTAPCHVNVTFVTPCKTHNYHVFMCACKFALDKFTLCVHNKRKIKRISPKCVLFHILFGKFVKFTAFYMDVCGTTDTWCAKCISWSRYTFNLGCLLFSSSDPYSLCVFFVFRSCNIVWMYVCVCV